MKKIFVIAMSLMMIISFTACNNNNSSTTSESETMSATISIDFPDNSGVEDVEDCSIEVVSGGSVLDALNAYVDGYNGEVAMDETSSTPYVVAINGVIATETAGWVYEVNDEEVMKSADECKINDGDSIKWCFTTWGE